MSDDSGGLQAAHRRAERLAAARRRRRLQTTLLSVGAALLAVGLIAAVLFMPERPQTDAAGAGIQSLVADPVGGDCPQGRLEVTAAPPIAPLLSELADRWAAERGLPPDCDVVSVTAVAAADVSQSLSEGSTDALGHVWVPDSAVWVGRVQASAEGAPLLPPERTTIARSPTVIAMPRPMAEALGWPGRELSWPELTALARDPETWARSGHPEWGPFRLALPEPARESNGLHAALAVGAGVGAVSIPELTGDTLRLEPVRVALLALERGSSSRRAGVDEQLAALRAAEDAGEALGPLAALPVSEYDVWRYNQGLDGRPPPQNPLVAVRPPEGGLGLDFPYMMMARATDEGRVGDASAFRDYLLSPAVQERFRQAGLRDAQDIPSTQLQADPNMAADRAGARADQPDGRIVAGLLEGWRALSLRFTTLSVIDVSGSMGRQLPGTGGTLLELVQAAGAQGGRLFAEDSHVGIWEFSTGLPGGAQGGDYRELVGIGPMGEVLGDGRTRREAIDAALRGMTPQNDTALYDTILAAYIAARDASVPNRPTVVVLFTDGLSDGDDLTIDGLLERLGQEIDPARPVQMVMVAFGDQIPLGELNRVVELTGGRVFTPSSPEGISQVFIETLTSPTAGG